MASEEPSALSLLADYTVRSLESETTQRDRLERRADTLVSTSGGLVALVAAAAALLPKPEDVDVPVAALILLLASLLFFLTTVFLARWSWIRDWSLETILNGNPMTAAAFGDSIRPEVNKDDDPEELLDLLLAGDMDVLRHTKNANLSRSFQLARAAAAQMAAVSLLAAAAAVLIIANR
jgi:hypothetical protein